jgi:hypothetical protein
MVLVAQFESFSYPFIIVLSLPLSNSFRAVFTLDHGTRLKPAERIRDVFAARVCQRERNLAGRGPSLLFCHSPDGILENRTARIPSGKERALKRAGSDELYI